MPQPLRKPGPACAQIYRRRARVPRACLAPSPPPFRPAPPAQSAATSTAGTSSSFTTTPSAGSDARRWTAWRFITVSAPPLSLSLSLSPCLPLALRRRAPRLPAGSGGERGGSGSDSAAAAATLMACAPRPRPRRSVAAGVDVQVSGRVQVRVCGAQEGARGFDLHQSRRLGLRVPAHDRWQIDPAAER